MATAPKIASGFGTCGGKKSCRPCFGDLCFERLRTYGSKLRGRSNEKNSRSDRCIVHGVGFNGRVGPGCTGQRGAARAPEGWTARARQACHAAQGGQADQAARASTLRSWSAEKSEEPGKLRERPACDARKPQQLISGREGNFPPFSLLPLDAAEVPDRRFLVSSTFKRERARRGLLKLLLGIQLPKQATLRPAPVSFLDTT